jgi:hypothetical protein
MLGECSRPALVALASLVAACASPPAAGRASSTAATTTATAALTATSRAPEPAQPAPPGRPGIDVSVDVRGPLRAQFDPSLGGAAKPSLAVVVTNRSTGPVDVSGLRVHLDAVREGVEFRCAKEVGPQIGDREPSVLAPGESFVFDRDLDCALPLVGAYAVRVAVSFGAGAFREPQDVRAFTLTVTALPKVEPREIAGVPGLWASMGSSNKIAGGVGRGSGHTLLTLVNSSRKPIEVPRMRIAMRVYRLGNPIPCEDKPIVLHTPAVLAPGDSYNEPVEISCLGLSIAGTYDLVAKLIVPRGSEGDSEISLGKLRVAVVTDPTLLIPPLMP